MSCPWDIQGQAVVGTEQPDGAVDAPSIAGVGQHDLWKSLLIQMIL